MGLGEGFVLLIDFYRNFLERSLSLLTEKAFTFFFRTQHKTAFYAALDDSGIVRLGEVHGAMGKISLPLSPRGVSELAKFVKS